VDGPVSVHLASSAFEPSHNSLFRRGSRTITSLTYPRTTSCIHRACAVSSNVTCGGPLKLCSIAWLVGEKKKAIKVSAIVARIAVQFGIAGILLYVPSFKRFLLRLSFCQFKN
jgi:hypothetical protein